VQSGIGFSQYTRLPPERNEIFSKVDFEVAGFDNDFVESLRADLVSNDDFPEKSTVNEKELEVVAIGVPEPLLAVMLNIVPTACLLTDLPVRAIT
jgi:hypothetical protein